MSQLLTPAEVAYMLDVSEITLKRMRLAGTGPPAVYLSARTIRYQPHLVSEWIDDNTTIKEGTDDNHNSGDT